MSTLLVLAAAADGASRTEAERLLLLARELGLQARALTWGQEGWRLGAPGRCLPEDLSAATLQPADLEGALLLLAPPTDRALAADLDRAARSLDAPRAGASPAAREVADDRLLTKLAASRLGARCAGHEEVADSHRPFWTIEQRVGLPCVVKPVLRRSALAWQRVEDQAGLREAVARAREAASDGRCLAESWLSGAPLAVTLLARPDGPPRILPLVSLDADREPRPTTEQLEELAALARGLGSSLDLGGLAVLELMLPEDGGRPVVLGLQADPSLAEGAPAALAGEAAGLSPAELLQALLAGPG